MQGFKPLAGSDNPIYKYKAIVVIDKPNAVQKNKYNSFKNGYSYLFASGQVFELDTESFVAKAITQRQLKEEMPKLFDALCAAKNKGFRQAA